MSDPVALAEKREQRRVTKAKEREESRKRALGSLLATVDGRLYVWDQLESCHIFTMSYAPNSFDQTAFREGERNVGNRLLTDIMRWYPASYLQMTKENSAVKLSEEGPEDE